MYSRGYLFNRFNRYAQPSATLFLEHQMNVQSIVNQSTTLCRPVLCALAIAFGFAPSYVAAQLFGVNNGIGSVGGVMVDAEGVVQIASQQEREQTLKGLRERVAGAVGDLQQAVPLRKISFKGLQAALETAISENKPLSEEVLYLAGLQRIQYLFVYPDQNDIVIAGPAEPWVVRADATVVGQHSLRPVVQLEDLLVAFRTVDASREQPISVSIEPTAEGSRRLRQLLDRVVTGPGFRPQSIEPAMRDAFGPQQVKFTTISTQSRMAQTLVAADYYMKRISMGLDDSPVTGLPSYLEMVRNGVSDKQQRWWLSTDYEAILKSDDALAWKLSGQAVKAMTEEELVSHDGTRKGTGSFNKTAQKWADLFTQKYDELCVKRAAFGDLRNVMDMNIVVTIIAAHQLDKVAGCDLSLLRGQVGNLQTGIWQSPKTIPPHCSFIRGARGWVATASGGVEINPWQVVSQNVQGDQAIAKIRSVNASKAGNWWWN